MFRGSEFEHDVRLYTHLAHKLVTHHQFMIVNDFKAKCGLPR